MRPVLLAIVVWLCVAAAAAHAAPRMEVQGTEFVVTLDDGRSLRSRDLVGAVLDVRFAGRPMHLRIAAVETDPQDRSRTLWLHTREVRGHDRERRNSWTAGSDCRLRRFPSACGP